MGVKSIKHFKNQVGIPIISLQEKAFDNLELGPLASTVPRAVDKFKSLIKKAK